MRQWLFISLTCTALNIPAAAQRAQQLELGLLGSYTRYDRLLNLENQFGTGGRVGWFVTDRLSLEFEAGYAEPRLVAGGDGGLLQGSASVVLNSGGERHSFYLLAGYSRLAFDSPPGTFSDNALHGALGDRIFLEPSVALRAEVRGIYTPSTRYAGGGSWMGHLVGSLGVSFFFGGRPHRDSDHDAVPDRRDACPGTATGATVDPRGCPGDSDRDGTANGLDACPNTPQGADTDPRGCPTDADQDAVPDGIDQCPATPARAAVDARGCPSDGDADRVADGVDQCPNTEFGAAVDQSGCPMDADRDGVPDGADRCPGTPSGSEVDTTGCTRTRDSDGDGVDDPRDRCPGTAPGAAVDASGCPTLFTPGRPAVVLRGVTFESGSASLKPESFAVLDVVAASLVANPDTRIEIAGHTDNTGSAAINMRLSQERADAVRSYLASRGVNRFYMAARGYGASQPIAPNTTAAGRQQNRRVELRRLN